MKKITLAVLAALSASAPIVAAQSQQSSGGIRYDSGYYFDGRWYVNPSLSYTWPSGNRNAKDGGAAGSR